MYMIVVTTISHKLKPPPHSYGHLTISKAPLIPSTTAACSIHHTQSISLDITAIILDKYVISVLQYIIYHTYAWTVCTIQVYNTTSPAHIDLLLSSLVINSSYYTTISHTTQVRTGQCAAHTTVIHYLRLEHTSLALPQTIQQIETIQPCSHYYSRHMYHHTILQRYNSRPPTSRWIPFRTDIITTRHGHRCRAIQLHIQPIPIRVFQSYYILSISSLLMGIHSNTLVYVTGWDEGHIVVSNIPILHFTFPRYNSDAELFWTNPKSLLGSTAPTVSRVTIILLIHEHIHEHSWAQLYML